VILFPFPTSGFFDCCFELLFSFSFAGVIVQIGRLIPALGSAVTRHPVQMYVRPLTANVSAFSRCPGGFAKFALTRPSPRCGSTCFPAGVMRFCRSRKEPQVFSVAEEFPLFSRTLLVARIERVQVLFCSGVTHGDNGAESLSFLFCCFFPPTVYG